MTALSLYLDLQWHKLVLMGGSAAAYDSDTEQIESASSGLPSYIDPVEHPLLHASLAPSACDCHVFPTTKITAQRCGCKHLRLPGLIRVKTCGKKRKKKTGTALYTQPF